MSAGDVSEPTPQAVEEEEAPAEPEAPTESEEVPVDGTADAEEVEDWQVALEVEGAPVVFQAAEGIKLEILDAQINDLPSAPEDVQSEVEFAFDAGMQVIAGVQMRVTNDTDQDIEWFPDQATLVIGGIAAEPDMFFSDQLGTMEGILAGTTTQADIMYVLPEGTSVDSVSTSDVRMKGSAPLDPETFQPIGEELDMTFSWAPE